MAAPFFSSVPLRYAWRALRRAPVFTVTATLTLALGVGATTAIFSVVNAVLLRPLPFPQSGQLVGMGHAAPGINMGEIGQSLGTYFTYRRLGRSFEEIGAYAWSSVSLTDASGAGPERLRATEATPSLFTVLRAAPLRGRVFTEPEGVPQGPRVVLISEEFWRRRYGADPKILGSSVQLDGRTVEVIGIMPASFAFPDPRVQVWTPLQLNPAATMAGGFNYTGVARLKPGATVESARADVDRGLRRVPELFPELAPGMSMAGVMESARLEPTVRPLRDDVIGPFGRVLWVVAATAALVLLVACANVANLLLVRSEARQKELTVRAALGAGRAQVLAHYVAEGVVLAVLGGGAGIVLAIGGVSLLVRYGPIGLPRLNEVSVDVTAGAFGIAAAFMAILVATLFPALRQGRLALGAMLREGGRSGTAGRARQTARGVLVAAQVALAMVLLAGSGLLARSVLRLKDVRPGFDATQVLSFRVDLPESRYAGSGDVVRFHEQLRGVLAAIPGVRSVGATSKLPLLLEGSNLNPVTREDRPARPDELPPLAVFIRANDSYFRTMSIPVVAGRVFSSMTDAQTPFEAVISRNYARAQWGDSTGAAALGQRVKSLSAASYTVVGVVETVLDSSLVSAPSAQVYFPIVPSANTGADYDLIGLRGMSVVIRTTGDASSYAPAVRRAVATLDPTLPIYNVRAMNEVVTQSYARLTFTLFVLAVAAGAALILGAVGLYGVVAYVVSLRTREIGLRIALGAQPGAVGRRVARQGVVLALAGAVVGLVVFLGVARTLRVFLFEIDPSDPVTLLGVTGLLVAVAAGASWIPARRASRIDPVEAMRAE